MGEGTKMNWSITSEVNQGHTFRNGSQFKLQIQEEKEKKQTVGVDSRRKLRNRSQ
jgi:hypothetical protein